MAAYDRILKRRRIFSEFRSLLHTDKPCHCKKCTRRILFNDGNGSIALSSGRGYTRDELISPHVAAPGINVKGALPGGTYAVRSGSSISAVISAGAVALLVQWAIYQLGFTGLDAY